MSPISLAKRLRPALLLLVLAASASAQAPLTVGQAVEGTLATGDADAYTLTLDADQFVLGAADQRTVDVVVTVTGPDGATLGEFDGPARGPEPFQFEAEAAGDYAITVTPFEDGEGAYALRIDRAEPIATTPEGMVRQLMAPLSQPDAPGGVVVVVQDDEVLYEEAFGLADLTDGRPYTLDTPTNIGSTSKQFTAFAIVTLAEQGALSLDDDVREYLPELPDFGEAVTLRHLLTHTSGYREFLNTLIVAGRRLDGGDAIDRDEIVRIIQRQPELQNAPGAEWNYNNSGFALLTLVVERVTGQPFDAWVAENVFAPVGMTDTRFRTSPHAIVPGRAPGYGRGGETGAWQEVPDLSGAMGAGGIYTTARDLARWMTAVHLGDAFPARYAQMTTRYVLADGDTTSYGLGVFVSEFQGVPTVHHGGADNAHRSAFVAFPSLDAGVLVLTNSAATTDGIAYRTAQAFFPDAFPDDDEAADPAADAAPFDPADFDDATFDAYAGHYALDEMPAFVLEFRRDGDRYLIQPTGQPATEIVPTSDATFASTIVDANLTFHRDADGVARSLTLHQGGDHPATRIEEPAEALDLAAFAGRYLSDEIETFYTVVVEGDGLVLRHLRTGDEPLAHASGDTFSAGGPTLTFERDESGAVTGFAVDFVRARGIHFERVE